MRLVTDSPELVELRGRPGFRSPLLVGLVLLAGLGISLVAAAEQSMTPERWAATLGLGAVATWLVRVGAPRPRVVRLHPGRGLVAEGGGAATPIGEAAAFRLGPAPPRHASAAARYGVWLSRPDLSPVLLVAGADPARVLADLSSLRRRLPLPVQAGWGLPPDSPWVDRGSSGTPRPPPPGGPGLTETREARQRITTTLLVGAAAVGTVLMVELLGRPDPDSPLRPLSVLLPLLSIALVVVLGLLVKSEGTHLTVGEEVVAEHRVLGLRVGRRAVPLAQVRAAHAVGPAPAPPRHLLLDTEGGPIALRGEPEDILRAQDVLLRAPRAHSELPSMRKIPGEQMRS